MNSLDIAKRWLADHNIKITNQRVLIVDYLLRHPGHSTANQIYIGMQQEGSQMAPATVYNNLHLLVEAGGLQELNMCGSEKVYDLTLHRHAHFVCLGCSCISDVELGEAMIPILEKMKEQGMHCTDFDLVFSGYCDECLERKLQEEREALEMRSGYARDLNRVRVGSTLPSFIN